MVLESCSSNKETSAIFVSACRSASAAEAAAVESEAPDLTGYGSRQWTIDFIRDPAHERFYGDNNDRMPAFEPADDPNQQILSPRNIELIVDWLRGDWPEAPAAISP